jgi:hypothetical protein
VIGGLVFFSTILYDLAPAGGWFMYPPLTLKEFSPGDNADFCRNCLSKWYKAEAEERGLQIDYEAARELIYGMPYGEWRDKFQKEASKDQLAKFAASPKK